MKKNRELLNATRGRKGAGKEHLQMLWSKLSHQGFVENRHGAQFRPAVKYPFLTSQAGIHKISGKRHLFSEHGQWPKQKRVGKSGYQVNLMKR
jgi:hypothetical protein